MATLPERYGLRLNKAIFGMRAGDLATVDRRRSPSIGDLVVVSLPGRLKIVRALDADETAIVAEDDAGGRTRVSPEDFRGVVVGCFSSFEDAA